MARDAIPSNKGLVPRDSDDYQQFIRDLREIRYYQEEVKELKGIHNSLHRLERAINPIETGIRGGFILLEDIPRFQKIWNQSTKEEFADLANASKEIRSLPQPHGWVEITRLQISFRDSLKELSSIHGSIDKKREIIRGSVSDLFDICRQQMFQVDDKLKEQVEELNEMGQRFVQKWAT